LFAAKKADMLRQSKVVYSSAPPFVTGKVLFSIPTENNNLRLYSDHKIYSNKSNCEKIWSILVFVPKIIQRFKVFW